MKLPALALAAALLALPAAASSIDVEKEYSATYTRCLRTGDAARGVPACVQCHGAALTGVLPNTPGLLGLPRDYLNSQLGAWRTGQRRAHAPDCMAKIARDLSPDDLGALTAWLSSQPAPANAKPAAALPRPPQIACGSAVLPAGRQQP